MNRQRRIKEKTFTFTETQLKKYIDEYVEDQIKKAKEDGMKDAVDQTLTLMFTLPLEVLMDFYWKKSYRKKIPEFVGHLLAYYKKWEEGELDMDQMKEDLWEYGGVKLEYK